MSDDTTKKPAHQRLPEFGVRHLNRMLSKLWAMTNTAGFDPFRDDRTNTKEKLVHYISSMFDHQNIDKAHAETVAEYPSLPGKKFRRRRADNQPSVTVSESPVIPSPIQPAPVMPQPDSAPVTPSVIVSDDKSAQIARLLALLATPQLDEARVNALINAAIGKAINDVGAMVEKAVASAKRGATLVEIKVPELPPVSVGIQHRNFPTLLKMANARMRDGSRLNVWLAGPAGVGKTTAARSVAQALNLPFYATGAIDQAYKLIGYRDANGNYAPTAFRQAWEFGGVFLFDEIDSSGPNAVLELNSALANGLTAFPDRPEPVARHPDCIVLAGANTFGNGGTSDYNGRMKQDAAFLDRFVFLDWPLDPDLEAALCGNPQWVSVVQATRARVQSANIRGVTISPRATLYGEALLAAGLDQSAVKSAVLRKGMAADQWSKVE